MAAAITGFYELTGWADRSPAGPYLAYTDGVAPRFMLIALLAALEHHRKTKQGQHIDLSQAEAAIHMIAPAVLDQGLNEHTWSRMGNRDLQMCPHAVFPARGEDRWVAIACHSDEAWRALCGVAGFTEQLADISLATVDGRFGREDELEKLISEWSVGQDENDLQARLIDAGVAAHVVQNSEECVNDPQLAYRQHFINVAHSGVGEMVIEGSRFHLSRTPANTNRAHPGVGEHNAEILTDVLGYDVDRMADVFASLAME
jgi:benzylsuccinate CoA-transferase BbsF subunit